MNKIIKFPKSFFQKNRPTISISDALKDEIPYTWPKEILNSKKEATLYSVKSPKKKDSLLIY